MLFLWTGRSTTWIIMMFPRTKISLQQPIPPCARNFWGRSVAFLNNKPSWNLLRTSATLLHLQNRINKSKSIKDCNHVVVQQQQNVNQRLQPCCCPTTTACMSIKACNHVVVQQQHYMNFTIWVQRSFTTKEIDLKEINLLHNTFHETRYKVQKICRIQN